MIEIKTKEDAIKATEKYLKIVTNQDRSRYEALRVLIDDQEILKKLELKSLQEYLEKYFPSEWKIKTTRNRLKNERMVHQFSLKGVEVSKDVKFTTTRSLMSAFYDITKDANERLEYRIRAWKLATTHTPLPTEDVVKESIEKVKIDISTLEELEVELEDCKYNETNYKSASKEHFRKLPDELQSILKSVGYPNMKNEFISNSINALVFIEDNNKRSIKDSFKMLDIHYKFMKSLLRELENHSEGDNYFSKDIVNSLFCIDDNLHKMRKETSIIRYMEKRINTLKKRLVEESE